MARLLEVYEELKKEAEFAKMAEEMQLMFVKYAETAENLLSEEYGKDYTTDDVESLARGLMERDSEFLEETEKLAEYDQIGRMLAQQYAENIKTAGKLDAALDPIKRLLKGTAEVAMQHKKETALVGGAGLAAGAAAGSMLSGGRK